MQIEQTAVRVFCPLQWMTTTMMRYSTSDRHQNLMTLQRHNQLMSTVHARTQYTASTSAILHTVLGMYRSQWSTVDDDTVKYSVPILTPSRYIVSIPILIPACLSVFCCIFCPPPHPHLLALLLHVIFLHVVFGRPMFFCSETRVM